MKAYLVLRKPSKDFNSIEKVFHTLLPNLKAQIIHLPYESKGVFNRVMNLLYLLKFRSGIIHLSGHDYYLFCLPFFKRSVLTIHDIAPLYNLTGIKKNIFKQFWLNLPISNSKQITTVSNFTKKEIELVLGTSKKINVISNPITIESEYTSKQFNDSLPRILHIGTKSNKNIIRLVKSLKGLNVLLVIIGEVDLLMVNLLKGSGLAFLLKENLSNSELSHEYLLADIVSFISLYEGFGLPILEAQSIGRVVITSNTASMPEVSNGGALLVNPYSIQDIRSGFKELISNEVLRTELIVKGFDNSKKYNSVTIAKQYNHIYTLFGNG